MVEFQNKNYSKVSANLRNYAQVDRNYSDELAN